ncbi:hypothetical protein FBU30_000378, partial [Linnemannia zychae]
MMKNDFISNFQSYRGDPMTLPSGAIFDKVIFDHVLNLKRQSSAHSFIWDSKDDWSNLFPSQEDRSALKDRIEQNPSMKSQLPFWQRKVIDNFDSIQYIEDSFFESTSILPNDNDVKPEEHKKFSLMIFDFMRRIVNFYEDQGKRNQLMEKMSENSYWKLWNIFFDLLAVKGDYFFIEEGEVSSVASAFRKNADRRMEDRQSGGHKADEIGAIEGGRKNEHFYGTKFMLDSLKMSKLLKDMFDFACNEACMKGTLADIARAGVEVYGFLISGWRIEFVSLRHFGGRFMYFKRENIDSLPLTLNNDSLIEIKRVLIKFL